MERQKNKQVELPELEADILQLCIFPESFETIVSECRIEKRTSIIADAIKNLIHYKLIIATNRDVSLSWVYDSDNMQESTFKATAAGIDWMESHGKQ